MGAKSRRIYPWCKPGRGRAVVEFDISKSMMQSRNNPVARATEWLARGLTWATSVDVESGSCF